MQNNPTLGQREISGFELLQNDENGRFYFTCNDDDCNPLLFSTDFIAEDIAKNALQDAIMAAKDEAHFQRMMQEEQFYFLLKDENEEPLAQSVLFDTEQELENKISYVHRLATAENIFVNKAEEKIAEAPAETAIVTTSSKKPVEKDKFAFKLDFYKRAQEAIVGKIENMHDGQSASFQGLDGETILKFIKTYLQPAPVIATQKLLNEPILAYLQLLSSENGQAVKLLPAAAAPVFMRLTLPKPLQDLPAAEMLPIEISTQELASGKTTQQFSKSLIPKGKGIYQAALSLDFGAPGAYRLKTALRKNNASTLLASCLIQVY